MLKDFFDQTNGMSELQQIKGHHERQLKNMNKKLTKHYQIHPNDVSWLIEKLERQLVSNWKLDKINRMTMRKNKHYREALEFYANRENYNPKHYDPNSDNGYMSTIDYDEGEKARQALESCNDEQD